MIKTPSVAVHSGSAAVFAAEEFCREKGYEIEELYSLTDCAVAVENGKYDYFICDEYDSVSLGNFKVKYVEDCQYTSQYSLCFKSESAELCEQFNQTIKDLTDSGTFVKISDSYKNGENYQSDDTVGNPLYILFPEGMEGYSSLNDEGEAEGIEVDLITAVCHSLGYTPVFSCDQYDECFDALINGEADMLLGVDYKSELGDDFIMSVPYFTVRYQVYTTNV